MNNKPDFFKDKEFYREKINDFYKKFVEKYPRLRWPLISFVVVVFILFVNPAISYIKEQSSNNFKKVLSLQTEVKSSINSGQMIVDIDEFERNLVVNQCNGSQFDILSERYFESVGGERFNPEKNGFSTKNTKGFQASSKTKWGCRIPFEFAIVSYPISGKSFGLFFEYENMFKILVGDGDRKTIRVEENKYGIRGAWPEIKDIDGKTRPSLVNPIEDNEEVTLIAKAKYKDEKIILKIIVLHSKFKSKEEFNFQFEPTAVNFQSDQTRKFRVGINDSRFKGEGTVIDLKTFSITEGEW